MHEDDEAPEVLPARRQPADVIPYAPETAFAAGRHVGYVAGRTDGMADGWVRGVSDAQAWHEAVRLRVDEHRAQVAARESAARRQRVLRLVRVLEAAAVGAGWLLGAAIADRRGGVS